MNDSNVFWCSVCGESLFARRAEEHNCSRGLAKKITILETELSAVKNELARLVKIVEGEPSPVTPLNFESVELVDLVDKEPNE